MERARADRSAFVARNGDLCGIRSRRSAARKLHLEGRPSLRGEHRGSLLEEASGGSANGEGQREGGRNRALAVPDEGRDIDLLARPEDAARREAERFVSAPEVRPPADVESGLGEQALVEAQIGNVVFRGDGDDCREKLFVPRIPAIGRKGALGVRLSFRDELVARRIDADGRVRDGRQPGDGVRPQRDAVGIDLCGDADVRHGDDLLRITPVFALGILRGQKEEALRIGGEFAQVDGAAGRLVEGGVDARLFLRDESGEVLGNEFVILRTQCERDVVLIESP